MPLLRRILQWLVERARIFLNWLNEKSEAERQAPGPLAEGRVVAEPELAFETPDLPRYAKKTSLFSKVESLMFRKLLAAVGRDYRLFAQVRLGDVIFLQNEPQDRKYHNNQIQCKHFDFLVCHYESYEPLLAIELNDESHLRPSRMQSDQFKQKVCTEIGLPLLWLEVGVKYTAVELAHEIRAKIGPGVASA